MVDPDRRRSSRLAPRRASRLVSFCIGGIGHKSSPRHRPEMSILRDPFDERHICSTNCQVTIPVVDQLLLILSPPGDAN